MISKSSPDSRLKSFASSLVRMLSGSRSCAKTPKYRLLASYSTRTSVSSVAGSPSRGSLWMNPCATGARAQSASSSAPSTRIGPSARTAGSVRSVWAVV